MCFTFWLHLSASQCWSPGPLRLIPSCVPRRRHHDGIPRPPLYCANWLFTSTLSNPTSLAYGKCPLRSNPLCERSPCTQASIRQKEGTFWAGHTPVLPE